MKSDGAGFVDETLLKGSFIELNSVNLIVGKNCVGKSNLLGKIESDYKVKRTSNLKEITNIKSAAMKLLIIIDPKITGISFKDSKIFLESNSGKIDPKYLCGGLSNVVSIIESLCANDNDIVTLDSVDAGLHYSVLPHLWEFIFACSDILNVKIICTTHNIDAIKSFANAWNCSQNEKYGNFMRLYYDNQGKKTIRKYTLDLLLDSLEMSVEVR